MILRFRLFIAFLLVSIVAQGQFITATKLDSVLNAIQENKLISFKIKNLNGTSKKIFTSLPKTGPQNAFPVYYETDGKELFITYIALSHEAKDYDAALENLKGIYSQLKSPLIVGRQNVMRVIKEGDTTVIEFGRRNKDKHYMTWYLLTQKQNDLAKYITLAIKTQAYDILDKEQEQKVKAAIKKRPKDYEEILKITESAKNGFLGNRFYPSVDLFKRWNFETDLRLADFDEFEIITNRSLVNNLRNPTFKATKNSNSQQVFEKYINLVESGLMVIVKEKTNTGFAYLVKGKDDIIINIKKSEGVMSFEVANSDYDVIIGNPDSPFGISNAERDKLVKGIAVKLQAVVLEGITTGKGFIQYPKGEKKLNADTYESYLTQKLNLPYTDDVIYFESATDKSSGLSIELKERAYELYNPALQIVHDNFKTKGLKVAMVNLKNENKNTTAITINEEAVAAVATKTNQLFIYVKPMLAAEKNEVKPPIVKENKNDSTNTIKKPIVKTHPFSKQQVAAVKTRLQSILKSVSGDFKSINSDINYQSEEKTEYSTKTCLFPNKENLAYPNLNATVFDEKDYLGKKLIYYFEKIENKYDDIRLLLMDVLDKKEWQETTAKRMSGVETTVLKSKNVVIELVNTKTDCYIRVGKLYYYFE
ncbi:MAG TPA: hypothetical protein PKI85_11960 [Chitinophagaceae bacterium]|nr:hypothetical protein [Chitinophagaceae bacterium]HNO55813.1 hypothetical protein [Chitinophagaceae bacterium]HRF24207.1 hypothetical protein [Chitinophagaceae bacterium]